MNFLASARANPKSTWAGIAGLMLAAYHIFGGFADGGFVTIDWSLVGQGLMEAAIGFGLLAARDADKSSESQPKLKA